MSDRDATTKVREAQSAALELANVSEARRNEGLRSIADAIEANSEAILEANAKDVENGEELLEAGEYSQALVDRLKLSESKLESIADMVRSVAGQTDPLGKTLTARELDDDLELYKVAVPIGVLGTVFESRPDALVQIAALSLKSGNAVILKARPATRTACSTRRFWKRRRSYRLAGPSRSRPTRKSTPCWRWTTRSTC